MFDMFIVPFFRLREYVAPFLLLCAIVLPGWLAFRVLRRRRGPAASPRRELLLLAFVLYLLALAIVTLAPNHPSRVNAAAPGIELHPDLAALTCVSPDLPRGSSLRGFCRQNAGGNILIFLPLGILLPLVGRRLRFGQALLIALALSCGIEITQYFSRAWGSYRVADVNDVILNGIGACLGLTLVFLLARGRAGRDAAASRTPDPFDASARRV